MAKRKTTKSQKEKNRSAILSDIAKIFVYWETKELSHHYAREVVIKLVEWGLLDPSLPLRAIKSVDTPTKPV